MDVRDLTRLVSLARMPELPDPNEDVHDWGAGKVAADAPLHLGDQIVAARAGADGLRLNPGNIGGKTAIKAVVDCARDFGLPIRIGVNAGSLEKELMDVFQVLFGKVFLGILVVPFLVEQAVPVGLGLGHRRDFTAGAVSGMASFAGFFEHTSKVCNIHIYLLTLVDF